MRPTGDNTSQPEQLTDLESAEERLEELQAQYQDLFECIDEIISTDPNQVPELFTVLLALPAFRGILNKQDLINKAVVEAKKLAKETEAILAEDGVSAPTGGTLNVGDLLKSNITKG